MGGAWIAGLCLQCPGIGVEQRVMGEMLETACKTPEGDCGFQIKDPQLYSALIEFLKFFTFLGDTQKVFYKY